MSRRTYGLACWVLAVAGLAGVGCPFGASTLSVSQVAFSFGFSHQVDSFTLRNTGNGALEWSIDPADVPEWLDVSPLSGELSDSLQTVSMELNAVASTVPAGTYQERITIESSGGNREVAVTLRITAAGDLIVEPAEINFGSSFDLASFTLRNGGTQAINWEIESIAPEDGFLSVAPSSPTAGTITTNIQAVELAVDRTGLDPGTYTGEVVVSSDAGDVAIPVSMVVESDAAQLSVAPELLEFETLTIEEQSLSVRNLGDGTLQWTIVDNLPDWLSVDTFSGSVSTEIDRVNVTVNATDLAPGTLMHTIMINSTEAKGIDPLMSAVDVVLVVPVPEPVINVSPLVFNFDERQSEGSFQIRNTGTGTLNWSLTLDAAFVSLATDEPTSGSLNTNNEIIAFELDRSTLSPGNHTGTITVDSNGGAATVTINFVVLPPTLAVVPQTLNFSTNVTEKQVAVFNPGAGTVTWSINTASLPSWLRDGNGNPLLSQTSGAVMGDETDGIIVGVNRVGQAPGNYIFDQPGIVVQSDAGDIPIVVMMQVSETPVLSVNTGFNPLDGSPNIDLENIPFVPVGFAQTATFAIQNTGTGTINWQINSADFPDWLTLSHLGPSPLAAADGPFEVTVTVNRGDLPFGPYRHRIFIQSNDDDNPLQPVDITMNVPKRVTIRAVPEDLDFGTTLTTDGVFVANFGDPDTVLNFGITSNKPWLFAFPEEGRSIGVVNPELNADFQPISVSIDRTGLDGEGGGTGTITVFAVRVMEDVNDIDGDGNFSEVIQVRDDTIAPPVEVEVAVQAAELFFEAPPARLRVPSLVRYVMMMRNLRFEPIPLADELLPAFQDNFFIHENNTPLELTETNQFLTSANNLQNDLVLLLDYSGSALESALMAQQFHDEITAQLAIDFPSLVLPDLSGFEAAADPLQFLYETCIGALLEEIPATYNISIMEFHDRNQPSRTVIGFTPNNTAGRALLIAALQGINVTGHGATELTDAIIDASVALTAQNSPAPSTGSVIPVTPFDDADVRTILVVSDGRVTSGISSVNDVTTLLELDRTRVLALAWGADFNGGPLSTIAAETGGHLYVTRALNTGVDDPNGVPFRVPSIYTVFDWTTTDLGADPCDLSIGQDLQSQVVLSYTTLSVLDAVQGRVSASFDDPIDGNDTIFCKLPDQGEIAGEFEQELPVGDVVGFDAAGLGVNLGQIAMISTGINAGAAELFIYVDYMPRDIRSLEFVFAAQAPAVPQTGFDIEDTLMGVEGVFASDGGIFEAGWTLQQVGGVFVDPTTSLNALRFRVDTNGDAIQYGAFGRLLKLDLDAPGLTPFNFRLLSVTPTTGNGELRAFTHPDGIQINNAPFKAPSFPTPRVTPTILNFGSNSTTQFFTIENVGGTYSPANVFLDWEIVGGVMPNEDITVTPDFGRLTSTTNQFTVRVDLNRSKPEVGPITDISFTLNYSTGVSAVGGAIPILVNGTILPPVMTITSSSFPAPDNFTLDFGSAPQGSGTATLNFTVANTGQSQLLWFQQDAVPAWMLVSAPVSVTAAMPQNVTVLIDRTNLAPGSTNNHTIQLVGTTADGTIISNQSIDVIVTVDP